MNNVQIVRNKFFLRFCALMGNLNQSSQSVLSLASFKTIGISSSLNEVVIVGLAAVPGTVEET